MGGGVVAAGDKRPGGGGARVGFSQPGRSVRTDLTDRARGKKGVVGRSPASADGLSIGRAGVGWVRRRREKVVRGLRMGGVRGRRFHGAPRGRRDDLLSRAPRGSDHHHLVCAGSVARRRASALRRGGRYHDVTAHRGVREGREQPRRDALRPGATHTLSRRAWSDISQRYASRQTRRGTRARREGARVARTDEVADLAIYLASDASVFMTGSEIALDGGWTAT